jgi:predicted metalloendopeptidase
MPSFRMTAVVVTIGIATSLQAVAGPIPQDAYTQDMDRSIKPGDDFYRYANGGWLNAASKAHNGATYDTRAMLTERTGHRVRSLIQDAADSGAARTHLEQKVGDYYASLMDEAGIDKKGLAPLSRELSKVTAITDKAALSAYLGTTLNSEADGLTSNSDHVLGVWVNQGFDDPRHYYFQLLQGGLGMPDRDNYLDPSSKMVALRNQYQKHIAIILKLAGFEDSESKAVQVLSLEIRLAESHAPDSDAADVFKQDNPWKRTEFEARAPGMDWNSYFEAAGIAGQSIFVVWQPSAVTGTSALVGSESLEAWKEYLRFHLIEHYASVLPRAFALEDFAFYGTILSGAQQRPDRRDDAVAATNAALGQAVGQLYTRHYFSPEAKQKAQAMVRNLLTVYRDRISNLTWMTDQTKKMALAKLDTLKVGLGYPDVWIDYSGLEVVRGDAFGNLSRAEAFNRSRNLAKLMQPTDPGEWKIDPQIVGAVILFSPNAETFSAGILQPPFFDGEGDAASNYGSAGAAIAHEISHIFDELGDIYDDQGLLRKWWTEEDATRYHAAAARLSTQFNGYCPFPDTCVNGKQVLNESIADLTGLLVAHDAYALSLKGKTDVVLGGLTGEQRFFLAYSQRWRRTQSEAALRQQIATDPHPPGEYRSDTVRNVDAWYKAYGVGPADKLYLKPEDRAVIW